jgi:uncharacterized protein (TIGR01244 family)
MKRLTACGAIVVCATELLAPGSAAGQAPIAVNHVTVTERLETSGQPSEESLRSLAERGIALVINLAPPTSRGAIATEAALVTSQGATYVNIPVEWQNPTDGDFELFSGIMQSAGERHVLVHCQANMRASAFTFLYRVVHEHVPPAQAFEAVSKVWIPRDQWAQFVGHVLQRYDIAFELPPADRP